jgi:hypothetical protein
MPLNYVNATGIGTGGINTDFPAWAIGGQQATNMQDVIIYENVARQRRGFADYLPVVPSAGLVDGIGSYYVQPLGGVVVTIANVGGKLYTNSSMTSDAWERIDATDSNLISTLGFYDLADADYVPRAQYRDEILLCDQSGQYPMLRTMGRWVDDSLTGIGVGIAANSSNVLLTGTRATPDPNTDGPGSYVHLGLQGDYPSFRVVSRSGDTFSLLNLNSASVLPAYGTNGVVAMWGTTWPTVEVYEDGLATGVTTNTVTISGGVTDSTADWGGVIAKSTRLFPLNDSIRVVTEYDSNNLPVKWQQRGIITAPTVNTLTIPNGFTNPGRNADYAIMRRSPFRDVEVHQECLWGCGVKQHPSRVYYSPRGWDMQTPPELSQPWLGESEFREITAGMMRYTDIEGAGDGDRVMALMSSDGPLLILTQRSCYGAYGSWPSFQRQMIAAGAGCIDTRSAVGTPSYGQFWCGRDGIYGYRRGKVTDLTSQRIGEHWRRLMDKFDEDTGSRVVGGLVNGHYIISCHLTRDGVDEDVTLALNIALGSWGYLSNMAIDAMQNPSMYSREELLIAARSGSTQLVDLAPAINMTGDAHDSDGTSPQLIIESGDALQSSNDPDSESRLVELRVSGIVDDTGAASPSSSLTVTTSSREAVTQADSTTSTTGVLEATGAAKDANLRRERVRIGNSGRLHSYTITAGATDADNVAIGVAEVGMNVRARRNPR